MRRESLAMRTDALERPVLAVSKGGAAAVDYPITLGRVMSIGTARGSTVVVGGEGVAPTHATLQIVSGQILLEDQQTPKGTSVNGQPVATCTLSAGDVIELGDTRMTLVDRAVTPQEAAPASGAGKIIRLGAVGLVTAVVMILLLRAMAPSAPPSETAAAAPAPAAASSAAQPPATPGAAPAAAAPSEASNAAATIDATTATVGVSTNSSLVRQTVANAVASGVDPVDALFDEGQSQLSAGRLREAARLFAAVLERRPTHTMARIRLVGVRQKLEETITRTIAEAERAETQLQYADALPMWESVLDLVETGDARAARARQGIDEAHRHVRR
jgi:hypothetical protein